MASIELRGKSYRIIFRFNGQRFARSLQTRSERVATAALHRLEDNLRRAQLGTLSVPSDADTATFLLSDGQLRSQPKRQPNVATVSTLGPLCDRYMDSMPEGTIEPTTRDCLKIHIRHFKREFGPRFKLTELDLAALQKYVNRRAKSKGRRGKPLSARTIKKEVASLSTIWAWAQRHGHVHEALCKSGLRYPKTDERPAFQTIAEVNSKISKGGLSADEQTDLWNSVYLTVDEISELLNFVRGNAAHPFIYPMFVFAAHTGARRSEIIRSKLHDIDLQSRRVTIYEKKRAHGHRTQRTVPMSPLLIEVLTDWFSHHPGGITTFPIESSAKARKIRVQPMQLTPIEASHHFKQTLKSSRWARLSGWHLFRHSFCSNCVAAGVDQRLIDAWVGHQTEEMRKRYRHLIPNHQADAISSVFGSVR